MNLIIAFFSGIVSVAILGALIGEGDQVELFNKRFFKRIYTSKEWMFMAVAVAMATLFLYREFGFGVTLVKYFILSNTLAAAGYQESQTGKVSNKLIVFGSIAGLILNAVELNHFQIISLFLGMACAGAILGFLRFFTKGGVAKEDIKTFVCAGAFLGFEYTLAALLMSTVLSGVAGVVMIAIKKAERKSRMPYIPFILAGAVFAVLFA